MPMQNLDWISFVSVNWINYLPNPEDYDNYVIFAKQISYLCDIGWQLSKSKGY